MAEWDVSKIAKALNDYNSKTVGNGEQKEIKVTTEDIRKALKELGKKEENPNEKTFVDFDDGAVAMPSDADLQKILEKLEKKGNKPDISISIQNQENGDTNMTTMALGEEGGDNISPNPEKPINKLPNPITLAMGENGDAGLTTMKTNEEGGDNISPNPEKPINILPNPLTLAMGENGDAGLTTMATNEEGGDNISPNPEKPINKLPNPLTLAMGENGDAINLTPEQKEKINKIFEDIQNGKIQQFPSLETTKAMGEEGGSSSLDGTISNEELAKLLKKYL